MTVWLVAIEKELSLPWASFYLGEGKAERGMMEAGSPLHGSGPAKTLHRMDHYPITVDNANNLLNFLDHKEALYEDHEVGEAREFLDGMLSFSFEDEYALYVEVG